MQLRTMDIVKRCAEIANLGGSLKDYGWLEPNAEAARRRSGGGVE